MDEALTTRYLLRGLKGGSGGGGRGGGSYGGSSYGGSSHGGYSSTHGGYYGGSSYSTSSSSSSGISGVGIIIIVAIVVIGIAACYACIGCKRRGRSGIGSDVGFEAAVAEAKRKPKVSDGDVPFKTYTGNFDVKYIDRGTEHAGTTYINLTHQAGGFKIKGHCSDADGKATITDGFVSYTGEAWWIEETSSGKDKGLKVLTEGKFNFDANALSQGIWRANTGWRGNFTHFQGSNVSKTFYPAGSASNAQAATASNPQTLEQMLEVDIPLAVATIETQDVPVVQAVAEPEAAIPTASALPAPSAPPKNPASNLPGPYVPRV